MDDTLKLCYICPQLAARKRIQDLEETILDNADDVTKEEIEKAVVDLAIKYRLASKHTSFVGVDDKAAKGEFELAMSTRDIKNQVTMSCNCCM